MEEKNDLQEYLTEGVEQIVKDALRATLKDPRESRFMAGFAAASAMASLIRKKEEKEGLHVPSYLIASITSRCNLHCAGCYSRSNNATVDCEPVDQLSSEDWLRIFREARELGVSFILLAGGEPLLRRDIVEAAGDMKEILFPIFTNGTFMDDRYFELFDRCRNLVPVMSLEGGREETDARRGRGIYDVLTRNMERLKSKGLIYGASITVTRQNLKEVVSDEFLDSLASKGCRAVFYIEYVPVTLDSAELAPVAEDRIFMEERLEVLRKEREDMIFVSFPGDEKSSGGCLAAGRGFFHINSHGGAEPCPFSAYSDVNVKDTSLREAMGSPLFRALRAGGLMEGEHTGGCVLFEKKLEVEKIVRTLKENMAKQS